MKINMQKEMSRLPKKTLIDLIEMGYKNFWSLQGYWFLFVENMHGTEEAIKGDEVVFAQNCRSQANRVKKLLRLGEDIPSLIKALNFAPILGNFEFEYPVVEEKSLRLRITKCPMHIWRENKGMARHPCKNAGLVSFIEFCKVISSKLRVSCIACPPDDLPEGIWCEWQFDLLDSQI